MIKSTTDFGFKQVSADQKSRLVKEVFSSVSPRYDIMNDLMSVGIHRLWKRFAVNLSETRRGQSVLDVAGGTGDMARLFHKRVGLEGLVVISDINYDMLDAGRSKMIDKGLLRSINYIQANAEELPFVDNLFDCVSIAFGLRNVTDKLSALKSMYEKTKYGGCLIILEFSTVILPQLKNLYDMYSFRVIPLLGRLVAGDEKSYRYLVESIRMHPDQETLKSMIESVGYSKVEYFNLSGGVVAIHRAYKL